MKLKFLILCTLSVIKKQKPLSIIFSNGIPKNKSDVFLMSQANWRIDCGLFATALATALAYGEQASKMRFVHKELRAHFVNCINKGAMSIKFFLRK